MTEFKVGDVITLRFDAEVIDVSSNGFPRIELMDIAGIRRKMSFVPEAVVDVYPKRGAATPEPQLFPIDSLLFKEPVTAGADIYVITALAKFYRGCNEHAAPIVVQKVLVDHNTISAGPIWRVMDGRHRVIASLMAGRKTVLGIEREF